MSKITTPERFFAKTVRSGECLIWQGKGRIGPYGTAGYQRKSWLAHRLAYLLATGQDPGPRVVRHSCDTPLCVEPRHLRLGEHSDNVADKVSRRRHRFCGTHPLRKLTSDQVSEMRRRYHAGGVLQRELAEEFGVSKQQVSKICRGERWADELMEGAA